MPSDEDGIGMWKGWWEGVIDLIPVKGSKDRSFSIESIFGRKMPRMFPEAERSLIRLIMPDKEVWSDMDHISGREWVDGKERQVLQWDLKDVEGRNMKFWWNGEGEFKYREFQTNMGSRYV